MGWFRKILFGGDYDPPKGSRGARSGADMSPEARDVPWPEAEDVPRTPAASPHSAPRSPVGSSKPYDGELEPGNP
jgi:hypothetical protein